MLRFNRVCLGAAKRKKHGQTIFCFDKDPAGRVMFMPSAWLVAMRYASKLANKHHAAVKKIDWCPVVVGNPRTDWRRNIISNPGSDARQHYAVHESFCPGDTVTLSAVLPEEILIADFEALLTIIGKYKGFSPFNSQEKYGTFEVIRIEPFGGPAIENN